MEILLENQSIPIEAFQENIDITKSFTRSLLLSIISYMVKEGKFDPLTDIHNVLGISSAVGAIITANVVNKTSSEIQTVYKIHGFNLGIMLGGLTGISLARRYITKKVPVDMKFLEQVATYLIYKFLVQNSFVEKLANAIVGKLLSKALKMPDYKNLLKTSVIIPEQRLIANPKTFIYSSFVGYIVGIFGTYYLIKKLTDVSFQEYLDSISEFFKPSSAGVIQGALLGIASKSPNIHESLPNISIKESKEVIEFSKIVERLFLNKREESFTNKKHKSINTKDLGKFLKQKTKSDMDLVQEKIIQAVADYSTKDKNFQKLISRLIIMRAQHDNACIMYDKNKQYKVCFIVAEHDSVFGKLTIREIQAILAHELGHAITGIFKIYPLAALISIFLAFSKSTTSNPFVKDLLYLAQLHALVSFARLTEIQADAYAIRKGLGEELSSALTKLMPEYYIELRELEAHDRPDVRLDAIKQATKEFYKLKKEILAKKK